MSTTQVLRGAALWIAFAAPGSAQEPVRLREPLPAGAQYHVSSRVELTGTLTPTGEAGKPAPKPVKLAGASAIEYDERVLAESGGQVQKALRVYRRIDFQRQVGGEEQKNTVRPAVRRLVLLRKGTAEVPFSPDGPLTWGELDLVRTDVFTPALAGLLPDRPVRPGDRWDADASAVQELTDFERLDEGKLECRFEEFTTLDRRRYARVAFAGTVRGPGEDGPGRQQIDGYLFFDLESMHLSYLTMKGVHALLDKDGKEVGRVEGQFVLTRQARQKSADLSDEALRGVGLEPDDGNTRLLYDNPNLGLRFLYSRRWRVAAVGGAQVALDGADGSGLLLTLDTAQKTPTGAQFLAESRAFLEKQKARVTVASAPRRLEAGPPELEHFALDVHEEKQRLRMEYYLIRTAATGVALAARLPAADAALQKEVEQLARSVVIGAKK